MKTRCTAQNDLYTFILSDISVVIIEIDLIQQLRHYSTQSNKIFSPLTKDSRQGHGQGNERIQLSEQQDNVMRITLRHCHGHR